jgi:hypothetical protein
MYINQPTDIRGMSAVDPAMAVRYAPGGDIYQTLATQYGSANADRVNQAYLTGESGAVAEELARIRFGPQSSTSTVGIFAGQMVTDPLGAPLDAANRTAGNLIGNTLSAIFRNPWVLIGLGVAGYYFWVKKGK